MNKNTKIILLSIISVLIIITIVLGITYSFMRPINETSSITSVNLESCANITLTDTGESINLSNSYPMTKNRAFETTPYTFTVSSSCTDGSGFNLYLATLNTNTLSDSSIHYIITEHGNKNVIVEGILSEATNGVSDFQDYELNELNNGINGTYGSIYRLHSSGINYNTEVTYDLYLYIDESVTNETMGQTFSAGLAVKASDYDFATVDEVTVTETTNDSITVSVSASGGTNAIGTYYYSINNGAYTSSSSNTYTFSGLSAGTSYSIRVYVTDTNGVQSNEYTLSATTDAYVNPVVNSVTATNVSNDSITVSVNANGGTNNIQNYYYSINNGAYTRSSSNTYTFSGLSAGQTYQIRVYVVDSNGIQSNVYNLSVQTDDTPPTLADTCRETGSNTLACHVATQYTTDGENGLYYHDADLANGAGDNSYRYAGANPNNYVCFGSSAATCPSDNLYRIIGVFGNQVKLIKADYTTTTMTGSGGDYYGAYSSSTSYYKGSMSTSNIASYYWNRSNGTSSTNTWSESRLNTTNLNSSYLSYIGSTWSNKIATTTWYVGGHSTTNATPATFQDAESTGTTYSAKIGLMYANDYGFAASPSYWTTNMSSYSSARDNNWMDMGLIEWTISRGSSGSNSAFRVSNTGRLNFGTVYNGSMYAVRPVFYLTSSITYNRGSGTAADPVRIN
ncbi:MAG TPA: fibronectin type III domain-containing protein [Candidatus Onthocola stercorigallinarum]|nr:fibronectin type III domain-containing protein [Candidatus Onthocola stercorigallinarum]